MLENCLWFVSLSAKAVSNIMIYRVRLWHNSVTMKYINSTQKHYSKSKCQLYINCIFFVAIFRSYFWEPNIPNQIKTYTHTHLDMSVCMHIHKNRHMLSVWREAVKNAGMELWQLCPQRLASGPIWQPVFHTRIHTHTGQLYLLLEPTEPCWAKMGLAAESLEYSLDLST